MAVSLLINTAGENIDSITLSGGSTSDTYSLNDLIAGNRSEMWRRTRTATAGRVIYQLTESLSMTHCVVARADLLLTRAGQNVAVEYHDGSNQAIQSYSPLMADDLVGIRVDGKPHGQDLVCAFNAPVTANRFQLFFDAAGGGSEANMFAKLYFCNAFHFGIEPDPEPVWSGYHAEKAELVKPLTGYEEYAVRDGITLNWSFVSRAKIAEFEMLNQRWGMFIYDSTGDIFEHRLEHVCIEQWNWERVGADAFNVEIRFRRLAHYA